MVKGFKSVIIAHEGQIYRARQHYSVRDLSNRGAELCNALKDIPPGPAWKKYEDQCIEIIHYLFENDLKGWEKQNWTDDDLNRFDLICRALTVSDFWSFLINDLKSRYILFEFKNYTDEIKQGQVLTTEKYLLKTALRTVAFLISRKGPTENAYKTTQGAMREHGKLIINLIDEDLCKMLHMMDNGEDPNDYLFTKVDKFLMTLPR